MDRSSSGVFFNRTPQSFSRHLDLQHRPKAGRYAGETGFAMTREKTGSHPNTESGTRPESAATLEFQQRAKSKHLAAMTFPSSNDISSVATTVSGCGIDREIYRLLGNVVAACFRLHPQQQRRRW